MNGVEFLLDTNIVIGLLKRDAIAVQSLEAANAPVLRCAISQISRMELLGYPSITSYEIENIQKLLQIITVVLVDDEVESSAIAFRRLGGVKLPDAIVAGTAIAKKLKLLTLDLSLREALNRNGFNRHIA